jgi:hypothetical protein
MKKLLTFVSAITAGAIGSASADVSVSGAGNQFYGSGSGSANSIANNEDSVMSGGGSVAFAMSTETANGVGVTASASITRDTDGAALVDNATAVGGMNSLTFAMDGMTIGLGDIDSPGSGVGEGGDVSSFASTVAGLFASSAAAANDSAMDSSFDGTGVTVSTTMGAASVDLSYAITQGSGANSFLTNATTVGIVNATTLTIGMDVGGASVTAATGSADANTAGNSNQTASALEISYPVSDSMTLSFGGSQGTIGNNDEDNMFASIAYTVDADTSLSIGYGTADNTTGTVVDKETVTTMNLTRSLGGGVSVFAEYAAVDADNAGTTTDGSAVAVGTTVSF